MLEKLVDINNSRLSILNLKLLNDQTYTALII